MSRSLDERVASSEEFWMAESPIEPAPSVVSEAEAQPAAPIALPGELDSLRQREFAEPLLHLTTLMSQSRRAFLLGAGCSKCAGLPLMDELTKTVLETLPANGKARAILNGLVVHFAGALASTIEHYMSELVDHLAISERRSARSATETTVQIGGTQYSAMDLTSSLIEIKSAIASVIRDQKMRIAIHRDFVRTVHRVLQSGKAGPSHAVEYFLLNYDTLIEDALSLEQIPVADGFVGGATGWWEGDAYRGASIQARVLKVHGSIDWCLWDGDVLPRRVRPDLDIGTPAEPVLIWPASTKYRETQRDPFAQIIDMMRQSVRPSPESQMVLTVCGYSFTDAHINIELDRALRESDGRLTILAFTSDDEPTGQLNTWRADASVRDQVRIHCNKGFFHGLAECRSNSPLLWWRFEILTRLLGGER